MWKRRIVLALIIVCAIAGGVVAVRAYLAPKPRLVHLADGTEIFYLSNTKVTPSRSFPHSREIKIDGDAFVRAAANAQPLVIRSRLMLLTVSGESALRVTAYAKETGEEAQVLYGHVEAKKSYPSPQNEPDSLVEGQEVMINETIDLQEKETTNLPNLRSWSAALVASVPEKNRH